MSDFQGAALVPWSECNKALESFDDELKWLYEIECSIFEKLNNLDKISSETVYWFEKNGAYHAVAAFTGVLTDFNEADRFQQAKKCKCVYESVRDLTNNGTRDAYLNPEQAAFVNRWGN